MAVGIPLIYAISSNIVSEVIVTTYIAIASQVFLLQCYLVAMRLHGSGVA